MRLDRTDRLFVRCKLSSWKGDPKRCRWCNKPLGKYARKWCTDRCRYRGWENHTWTWARSAALSRDMKTCQVCGSRKNLEVNHIKAMAQFKSKHNMNGCWHHLENLCTLCHDCHVIETKAQYERGDIVRRSSKRP